MPPLIMSKEGAGHQRTPANKISDFAVPWAPASPPPFNGRYGVELHHFPQFQISLFKGIPASSLLPSLGDLEIYGAAGCLHSSGAYCRRYVCSLGRSQKVFAVCPSSSLCSLLLLCWLTPAVLIACSLFLSCLCRASLYRAFGRALPLLLRLLFYGVIHRGDLFS